MSRSEKRQEWKIRLGKFQESGQSMRHWCREQQIPYERMKYWKYRLREDKGDVETEASEITCWGQIAVSHQPKPSPKKENQSPSPLILRFREISIEIPIGFDAVTLREVLSAVPNSVVEVSGTDIVYLACGATDMRKAIDGLAGMVEQHFKLDPFSRAMFAFCNKDNNKMT